jgi:CTP synthase (UTP-ammonia lyase)
MGCLRGYGRRVPTRIALLGDLDLGKPTHRELEAAVALLPAEVQARWLPTDHAAARKLTNVDGLWVVPGSPYRDDDAVEAAIAWALGSRTPLLGTCGGFQYALLVLARRLAGMPDARHAETEPDALQPLLAPLSCSLIGQQREVRCLPGTRLAAILGTKPFIGFHWCGYGLAESFVGTLEDAGVVISARAPDAGVEAIEIPDHPFFIATLFQPQVGALAGQPLHPLIGAFLEAAQAHQRVGVI